MTGENGTSLPFWCHSVSALDLGKAELDAALFFIRW